MPIYANTELRCDLIGSNTTLVKIKWDNASLFQFAIDPNKKMDMFLHGYQMAEYKDKTEYIFIEGLSNFLTI